MVERQSDEHADVQVGDISSHDGEEHREGQRSGAVDFEEDGWRLNRHGVPPHGGAERGERSDKASDKSDSPSKLVKQFRLNFNIF